MAGKYCRICWNTADWRRPTGNGEETEGSYYAENGFGHEEWLFNPEWLIDGYKYAYLQPFNKFPDAHGGKTFDVLLYARPPKTKSYFAVAVIRNLYVLKAEELGPINEIYRNRGWVRHIREDLEAINICSNVVDSRSGADIANVRISLDKVEPLGLLEFPPTHLLSTYHHRYHPYNWDGSFPWDVPGLSHQTEEPTSSDSAGGVRFKSEDPRTRAAQKGQVYDPQHDRPQNRVVEYLLRQDENGQVETEKEYVDIKVTTPTEVRFYEVKIAGGVRQCIRQALGQLLEYAHYSGVSKADRLITVGDQPPGQADRVYLRQLRAQYGLPFYYQYFDGETLQPEV